MDSECTCSVPEMTMKLVNRIILVTAHIVRATNMRMIICFMIFLFHLAAFQRPNRPPNLRRTKLDFLQQQDSFTSYFIPGVHISFDSEERVDLAMTAQASGLPTLEHKPSHESPVHSQNMIRIQQQTSGLCVCKKLHKRWRGNRLDRYQFAIGRMLEASA